MHHLCATKLRVPYVMWRTHCMAGRHAKPVTSSGCRALRHAKPVTSSGCAKPVTSSGCGALRHAKAVTSSRCGECLPPVFGRRRVPGFRLFITILCQHLGCLAGGVACPRISIVYYHVSRHDCAVGQLVNSSRCSALPRLKPVTSSSCSGRLPPLSGRRSVPGFVCHVPPLLAIIVFVAYCTCHHCLPQGCGAVPHAQPVTSSG